MFKQRISNLFVGLLLIPICCGQVNSVSPCNGSVISSSTLGDVSLGESFDSVLVKFPNAVKHEIKSEGTEMVTLKIVAGVEYLQLEFEKGLLTQIKSNCANLLTSTGVQIGSSIEQILKKGENIEEFESLAGELTIKLTKSNVKFRLSKESEVQYFNDGGDFSRNVRREYKVREFIVR